MPIRPDLRPLCLLFAWALHGEQLDIRVTSSNEWIAFREIKVHGAAGVRCVAATSDRSDEPSLAKRVREGLGRCADMFDGKSETAWSSGDYFGRIKLSTSGSASLIELYGCCGTGPVHGVVELRVNGRLMIRWPVSYRQEKKLTLRVEDGKWRVVGYADPS